MATAATAHLLFERLPEIQTETARTISRIQPYAATVKTRQARKANQPKAAGFPWAEIAWVACLKIIPNLKTIDVLLGDMTRFYATEFDCETPAELQKATHKIEQIRDLVRKLLTLGFQCGLSRMWLYKPIFERITDHCEYLNSIHEGFILSADNDFFALIRDTIGATTSSETPDCVSAK